MSKEDIIHIAKVEIGMLEGIYTPYNPTNQWKRIAERSLEIQALKIKNLAFDFFRDELAYPPFIKRLNEICSTQFHGKVKV